MKTLNKDDDITEVFLEKYFPEQPYIGCSRWVASRQGLPYITLTRHTCTGSTRTLCSFEAFVSRGTSYDWKARSCKREGCDPEVDFESKEFKRHVEKNHSPYTPSRCQFPGCSSEVAYATAMTYRHHLRTHGLNDRKEKDKYMPGKKPAFIPQKCQIPGCISTAVHATPGKLRDHPAKKHEYLEDDIEDYLSLQRD